MLRRQLPAYSPVSIDALAAGFAAVFSHGNLAGEREQLCQCIRQRCGGIDLLLTDSGTASLQLAIAGAAAASPESAAALPAYCCYDVATAADGAGVPVALYDVDPATLAPQRESLERVLNQRISSIVVAHLYGHPVDVAAVQDLAGAQGRLVIEDAAQGIGGRLRGAPLGTFGSLTVLSFGRGKGWTGGTGGALIAQDDRGVAILEWARKRIGRGSTGAMDVVRLSAQALVGRPWLYALPASLPFLHLGETIYRRFGAPGSASTASVATAARTAWLVEGEVNARRANGERLLIAARMGGRVQPVESPHGAEPGFLRLPVLCRPEERAGAPRSLARLGIAPGYPEALCDLNGFGDRVANRDADYSGARTLAKQLVTLPTHSLLTERDLERLEHWLGGR